MTRSLGVKAWATGTMVLVAVTACSNPGPDPTPVPPSSSSPSAPSTSPSLTSPSDAAATAASETMRRYFVVVDELGKDPDRALKKLNSVATSTQLSAEQMLLRGQHDRGERQIGDTRIAELTVQSVNLDNSDPAEGKAPTVTIDVCWDVTAVDVVDRYDMSIVPTDRPDAGWTRYVVANYNYAADPAGGWRVATGNDLEQAPCVAS